jgi:arylsulfatase A-like enzyme
VPEPPHAPRSARPRRWPAPHPINDHIPLILAGPNVTRRRQLTQQVSLLDVPPTLLWWFGLDVPVCYEGRALTQAFTRTSQPAEAAV